MSRGTEASDNEELAKGDLRPLVLSRVAEVAAGLLETAHQSADDAVWVAYKYNFQSKRYHLAPLDYGLYGGAAGLAIFFAALARVAGSDRWRSAAMRTLEPLRRDVRVEHKLARLGRRLGVGLAEGLGSLVYGLTVTSVLLDDRSLVDDADLISSRVPHAIADESGADLLGGVAGALVSVLGLYRVSGNRDHLQIALRVAEQLCGRLTSRDARASDAEARYAGLAHGRAGLALAIHRLRQVATAESHVLEQASLGVFSEVGLDPYERDLTWCYGVPGIAQLELATRDHRGSSPAVREIIRRLDGLRDWPQLDHVCCGKSGVIDALLSSLNVDPANLPGQAAACLEFGIRKIVSETPKLPLVGQAGIEFAPGFFQGWCGIGYTMLRFVDRQLPSVCSFDVEV